ncbi:hypothetical protein CW731_07215 [Polaribacter sp. ALD11]|uniref:sensor histidine kinase n=1 Tax=Polaribacter sp. ALD11 TaxID=2058137 RepID=UPI000C30432B|nr:histidine kinase [Polaribacter sp. ALD11]AUC85091.1 hypothetical protein CW731_07215 [Polaribacter sp. ALD11]
MKYIHLLILLILLFANKNAKAQHPIFTHLTEKDGLPDIEFYDIVEDSQGFIWLAANKGLFRYDGKEFKNYTHPDKQGLSVFGLKIDSTGKLWCNNISDQFFYIKNDELILFTSLEEGDSSNFLTTFSFYQNKIVVSTKSGFIEIDINTLKKTRLFDSKTSFLDFQVRNDTVIFLEGDDLKIVSKNKKKIIKESFYKYNKSSYNKWTLSSFNKKNLIYAYNSNGLKPKPKPKLFYEEFNRLKEFSLPKNLENNIVIKFVEIDDKLWVCTYGGVFVYRFKKGKFQLENTYFKEKAITGILKDRNNNYWITSLRDGVYIIPNINIEKYDLEPNKTNISAMSRLGNNALIFGSTKGDIAILNVKTNKLKFKKNNLKEKVFSIAEGSEKVFLSLNGSFLIYDKKKDKFYKDKLGHNAKDLSYLGDNLLLRPSHQSTTIINTKDKNVTYLNRNRAYTSYYNRKEKEIYVGTITGLKKYDEDYISSKITFNNKPIFAIDIDKTDDSTIWISTFKDGLIGVKKNKETINYTNKNGLLSNRLGKIKGDGNLLWISNDKGLQVLNTITGTFKNLTQKDGLNSLNISEIIPFKNELFLSSNKGLFKLNKEKAFKKRTIYDFYFKNILVDNVEVPEKEKYELNSSVKKIEFNFHNNGFLSEDNLIYQYKLIDASNNSKWNNLEVKASQLIFNNLAADNYTLKLRATDINENKTTTIKSIKIIVKPPFYKEWWFRLSLILLVTAIVRHLSNLRVKKIRLRQKELLEKEQIQKQLVYSKLKNLQSQMNPHFTFNALNSIQNLVLKGNKHDAYDYLTKFSLLIRENLNMSEKSFVTVEEEIKMLTKYLELEQLRFRDNFEYDINLINDISEIKIPTMIIQPYVENAIKHGLLNKQEGRRKLLLSFKKSVTSLICIVEDNGVGIEKAKEINKNKQHYKKSFSTGAIEEKMIFLKEYYKTDIGITYQKVQEGTRVVIKIPYN